MSRRVLVVLLDAFEKNLIEEWVEEGRLPHFSRLIDGSREYRVRNRVDLLPDSLFGELATGRSVASSGDLTVLERIHTGEATTRMATWSELHERPYFWRLATERGKRVIVVDAPAATVGPDRHEFQIQDWGMHFPLGKPKTCPPEALEWVLSRFGPYPVDNGDLHLFTEKDLTRLRRELLAGLEQKTSLIEELLGNRVWDLAIATLSEAHVAGHRFWHLHESSHPDHPEKASEEFRNSLRSIYEASDRSLGRILQAVESDTVVMAFATHGFQRFGGAQEMTAEFAERLGLGAGKTLRLKLAVRLPRSLKRAARSFLSQETMDRHQLGHYARMRRFAGPEVQAIAAQNQRIGAFRLNLRGREPEGRVREGAEADGILDMIEEELHQLRDVRTGEPVVSTVTRSREAFGENHHPDIPDLFVDFRTDIGPIDAMRSKRVGLLRRPKVHFRTGDHTSNSRLWVSGLAEPAGKEEKPRGEIDILDVPPTILELLGIDVPDHMDGDPVALSEI